MQSLTKLTTVTMAATIEADDIKTLIAEQRRELMAAKASESDMDMAFKLQIEEAIAASLFLSQEQPSSSSSRFLSPKGDDSTHISDILIAEIERYEQEQTDFELCKNETRKIKQDLSIRLHDQKFASEIVHIPDQVWQVTGDNFHKPYLTVGLSSSNAIDQLLGNEFFRLYFKGIVVDHQSVNDLNKLWAIGVAICDPKDDVIFELSKPLLDETDMRGEIVDIKALIEGLDAALALDLKRIVYYCDDLMLHQYVSGRREPAECSMTDLIRRVNLLHEKFVYCSPLLVARTDIKFAFKLARSAIYSQLTRSAGSSGKNVKVVCSICYEDTNAQLMFTVDGCRHQYCSFCVKQHVEVKVLNGDLPKCPYEGCKSEINIGSCQKILEPKLLEIMSQRVKEATIPAPEKVYCPSPTCAALMSRSEVKDFSKTSVVRQEQLGASRCVKCRGLFCIDCKAPWHSSMSCKAYRHHQSNSNNADTKLKSLATRKRWRQCSNCSNMVELAHGCYHITCRCGHGFCYTCGAEWKDKKPTCSCKIWDERNIIRSPDGRYQRRG